MNTNAVHIRPARPELAEGRAFARFIDEIVEGGFRILLGRRTVDILARAFQQPGHTLSYESTSFAESDGRIVAMVCGYMMNGGIQSEDEALMIAPGNRIRRRLGIAFLRLRWRMIGYPFPGEFYVEFLIVDSKLRGNGIGRVLMDRMEKKARAAGASRLTLDVTTKNTAGQRFYSRYGMVQVPDWPRSSLGRRAVLRMTKPLA